MDNKRHPIAYLTCEIKGRDLDSRMLVAAHLVQAGYSVVVGQQWSIFANARLCPPGCVFFKTTNKLQSEWMVEFAKRGHAVIVTDEESLPSSTTDLTRMTHPDAIRACHAYLALNHLHAEAIVAAYPDQAFKVSTVGNVRVDILRAASPPRPLPEDYILINTSFGIINSVFGDVQRAGMNWVAVGGLDLTAETEMLVRERIDFERRAMDETFILIDWLLAKSRAKIVIRPHPSETVAPWISKYGNNARILIVERSAPLPWMKHARVLIHSESSTGVEAAILGTPTINLSPPSPWRERLIVSDVNVTTNSAAEAQKLMLSTAPWPTPRLNADALFPHNATERVAQAIARTLPSSPHKGELTWHRLKREPYMVDKFTVSLDEVRDRLPGRVTLLDDSLFLVTPT